MVCHCHLPVTKCFTAHPRMVSFFFPAPSHSLTRGILFLTEVEHLWPPATWSNISLWQNECWVSGHICRGLPEMNQAAMRFFPGCISGEDTKCNVDESLWPDAEVLLYTWTIHIVNIHSFVFHQWNYFRFILYPLKSLLRHLIHFCDILQGSTIHAKISAVFSCYGILVYASIFFNL